MRALAEAATLTIVPLVVVAGLPGTEFALDTLSRDEVWVTASESHLVNIETPSVRVKAAAFYSAIDSIPRAFPALLCGPTPQVSQRRQPTRLSCLQICWTPT